MTCFPMVHMTHRGEHPRPNIESLPRYLRLRGECSPGDAGRRSGERPRGKGNIDVENAAPLRFELPQ